MDNNDDLIFDEETLPFLTKDTFAKAIEKIVLEENVDHFNAIIAFCEDNNQEYEAVIKLMSPTLLEKVKQSARDAGLVDKVSAIEGL
jgi:hypothetical protein